MENNNILVSIDCTAYNHEAYIADTLESFILQKTDFDFEILIHDDASTDGTAEIIKEYEKRYPDLIKAVYQTENQYSKGVAVELINHYRAKGKYLAICEGDDYWTDPLKLQKQVDYMESHPECSMCVHAAYRVAADSRKAIANDRPSRKSRSYTTSEIIYGGGRLFATSSFMYSMEKIKDFPDFYFNAGIGDYPLTIYASLKGTVYYLDDNMSVYRVGVNGSWTEREFSTTEKRVEHFKTLERMLGEIDAYTNYKFTETIGNVKKYNEFYLLMETGGFKKMKKEEYRELYKKAGLRKKLGAKLKFYFPKFSFFLKTAKYKILQYAPRKKVITR